MSAPQPPAEAQAQGGGEVSFDRRFADMLIGILGDVQDELGFTDEDKLCANGSAEIVAAIRELKERAVTAPPSAPVGVDTDFLLELREYFQEINADDEGDDYMNSSDEAIRLIDSKLEAMRYCAALAQQPAAVDGLVAGCRVLLEQYEASGDFTMGGKLTNKPFMMIRDSLNELSGNSGQLPALTQQPTAVGVPKGYALVPVEPTWEQMLAGVGAQGPLTHDKIRDVYAAMLAAAKQGVR